jgi:hypothetical protein
MCCCSLRKISILLGTTGCSVQCAYQESFLPHTQAIHQPEFLTHVVPLLSRVLAKRRGIRHGSTSQVAIPVCMPQVQLFQLLHMVQQKSQLTCVCQSSGVGYESITTLDRQPRN